MTIRGVISSFSGGSQGVMGSWAGWLCMVPSTLLSASHLSLPPPLPWQPLLWALSGSAHHCLCLVAWQAACVSPQAQHWLSLALAHGPKACVRHSAAPSGMGVLPRCSCSPAPSFSPPEPFLSFPLLPSCVRPVSLCTCVFLPLQISSLLLLLLPLCC